MIITKKPSLTHLLFLVIISLHNGFTFTLTTSTPTHTSRRPTNHNHLSKNHITILSSSSAPSDVDSNNYSYESYSNSNPNDSETKDLKLQLLRLCASYDRGFGASVSAKQEVDDIVDQLKLLNPTPYDAAAGIDGTSTYSTNKDNEKQSVPLKGIWRMVWTTALDVLNLGASPIATPAAIYQVIDPPTATNIIDFIPRVQSLFPSSFPSSLIRAEVKTRTSKRKDNTNSNNRVGLDFEAVKLEPVQFLGIDVKNKLPQLLNVNLPKINVADLPGVNPDNSPGFFDVVYLDEDMLIIQQNAPGGYFVSIKVLDCDP